MEKEAEKRATGHRGECLGLFDSWKSPVTLGVVWGGMGEAGTRTVAQCVPLAVGLTPTIDEENYCDLCLVNQACFLKKCVILPSVTCF